MIQGLHSELPLRTVETLQQAKSCKVQLYIPCLTGNVPLLPKYYTGNGLLPPLCLTQYWNWGCQRHIAGIASNPEPPFLGFWVSAGEAQKWVFKGGNDQIIYMYCFTSWPQMPTPWPSPPKGGRSRGLAFGPSQQGWWENRVANPDLPKGLIPKWMGLIPSFFQITWQNHRLCSYVLNCTSSKQVLLIMDWHCNQCKCPHWHQTLVTLYRIYMKYLKLMLTNCSCSSNHD